MAIKIRPNLAPTYSLSDLVTVGAIAAVVALWAAVAGGAFSPLVLLSCAAVLFSFYLAGSLWAGWKSLTGGVLFDLPLRLIAGYATVNSALFALAWLSPLGIVANFGLVLALLVAVAVVCRPAREKSQDTIGFVVIGLSLIATTLWCQDSLRPPAQEGNAIIFKPWIDSFYHAVHLRIFGAGHGAASIEDFRLAGIPARLYHYGVYLTPALIRQAAGMTSYSAFAGILAPLGVFFTGLAAYALVGTFWGRWPGLAACAALLLLPDGSQQGIRDTLMSYHWLTQISPSAPYGLALVAMAWLFVMRGCERGSRLQVIAGWLVAGLLLFYKAHFFIAIALLLLLIPPVFFRGPLAPGKRVVWAAGALGAYLVTTFSLRNLSGVPLIRLDGSSIAPLLELVAGFTQPGRVRDFVTARLGTDSSLLSNLGVGIPFILLATLGLLLPLLIVLAIRLRRRAPALFTYFPLIVLANFLVMFFGLALDARSSTPEELSHRPVMVVYFVVVAWLGGAAATLLIESKRLGRVARPLIVALAVLLVAVPTVFGSGVHRMPALRSISPPLYIPAGLVQVAHYIRDHSNESDLIQDSRFDRYCIAAALSERRTFVARSQTIIRHNEDQVEERAEAVRHLMDLREPITVAAAARNLEIRWFLLSAGDRVNWPPEIVDHPVFQADGFRLYRF